MVRQRIPSTTERRAQEQQEMQRRQQIDQRNAAVQEAEAIKEINELLEEKRRFDIERARQLDALAKKEVQHNLDANKEANYRESIARSGTGRGDPQFWKNEKLRREQVNREMAARNQALREERAQISQRAGEYKSRLSQLKTKLSPDKLSEVSEIESQQDAYVRQAESQARAEADTMMGRTIHARAVAKRGGGKKDDTEGREHVGFSYEKGTGKRTPIYKTTETRKQLQVGTSAEASVGKKVPQPEIIRNVSEQTANIAARNVILPTSQLSEMDLSKKRKTTEAERDVIGKDLSSSYDIYVTEAEKERMTKDKRTSKRFREALVTKQQDIEIGTQIVDVGKDVIIIKSSIKEDPKELGLKGFEKKDDKWVKIEKKYADTNQFDVGATTSLLQDKGFKIGANGKLVGSLKGTETIEKAGSGGFFVGSAGGFEFDTKKIKYKTPTDVFLGTETERTIPISLPKKVERTFKTPEEAVIFGGADIETVKMAKKYEGSPGGVIGLFEAGLSLPTNIVTGTSLTQSWKDAKFVYRERGFESQIRRAELEQIRQKGKDATIIPMIPAGSWQTAKNIGTDVGEFGLFVFGSKGVGKLGQVGGKALGVSSSTIEKGIIAGATGYLGYEAYKDPTLRKVSLATTPLILTAGGKGLGKTYPYVRETGASFIERLPTKEALKFKITGKTDKLSFDKVIESGMLKDSIRAPEKQPTIKIMDTSAGKIERIGKIDTRVGVISKEQISGSGEFLTFLQTSEGKFAVGKDVIKVHSGVVGKQRTGYDIKQIEADLFGGKVKTEGFPTAAGGRGAAIAEMETIKFFGQDSIRNIGGAPGSAQDVAPTGLFGEMSGRTFERLGFKEMGKLTDGGIQFKPAKLDVGSGGVITEKGVVVAKGRVKSGGEIIDADILSRPSKEKGKFIDLISEVSRDVGGRKRYGMKGGETEFVKFDVDFFKKQKTPEDIPFNIGVGKRFKDSFIRKGENIFDVGSSKMKTLEIKEFERGGSILPQADTNIRAAIKNIPKMEIKTRFPKTKTKFFSGILVPTAGKKLETTIITGKELDFERGWKNDLVFDVKQKSGLKSKLRDVTGVKSKQKFLQELAIPTVTTTTTKTPISPPITTPTKLKVPLVFGGLPPMGGGGIKGKKSKKLKLKTGYTPSIAGALLLKPITKKQAIKFGKKGDIGFKLRPTIKSKKKKGRKQNKRINKLFTGMPAKKGRKKLFKDLFSI